MTRQSVGSAGPPADMRWTANGLAPRSRPALDYAAYAALPGIRFSDLSRIAISPLHYRARADGEPSEDSAAMALGRAIHCAVLEPDRYNRTYVRRPDEWSDWRTKAAQAWRAEAEAAGRVVLGTADAERVVRIARAVHGDRAACRYLREGEAERVLEWQRADGRRCKARLDWLGVGPDGALVVLDLKTTRLQTAREFGRSAAGYYYHAQLAWYRGGLAAMADERHVEARIVTVSTLAPYDVAVYRVTEDMLAAGTALCDRWLAILDEAERDDCWPGIANGEELDLELPDWAYPEEWRRDEGLADLGLTGGES